MTKTKSSHSFISFHKLREVERERRGEQRKKRKSLKKTETRDLGLKKESEAIATNLKL